MIGHLDYSDEQPREDYGDECDEKNYRDAEFTITSSEACGNVRAGIVAPENTLKTMKSDSFRRSDAKEHKDLEKLGKMLG